MAEAVHVDVRHLGAPADALQGLAQNVAVQGFQLGGDEKRLGGQGVMALVLQVAPEDLPGAGREGHDALLSALAGCAGPGGGCAARKARWRAGRYRSKPG